MNIVVEMDALKDVEERLGKSHVRAPALVKKAVNRTVQQAEELLVRTAKETYTVKKPNFRDIMKHESATVGHLTAVIRAESSPLPLTRFKFSAGKTKTKVQVLKSGHMKELRNKETGNEAFCTTIKKGGKASRVVAERLGKGRYPFRTLSGNSLAVMVGGSRTMGKKKDEIYGILKKNIDAEVQRFLESAGK